MLALFVRHDDLRLFTRYYPLLQRPLSFFLDFFKWWWTERGMSMNARSVRFSCFDSRDASGTSGCTMESDALSAVSARVVLERRLIPHCVKRWWARAFLACFPFLD